MPFDCKEGERNPLRSSLAERNFPPSSGWTLYALHLRAEEVQCVPVCLHRNRFTAHTRLLCLVVPPCVTRAEGYTADRKLPILYRDLSIVKLKSSVHEFACGQASNRVYRFQLSARTISGPSSSVFTRKVAHRLLLPLFRMHRCVTDSGHYVVRVKGYRSTSCGAGPY